MTDGGETDARSTHVTTRLTRSHGTKRVYGAVYPNDLLGVGFNTRWGGYYFSVSITEKGQEDGHDEP